MLKMSLLDASMATQGGEVLAYIPGNSVDHAAFVTGHNKGTCICPVCRKHIVFGYWTMQNLALRIAYADDVLKMWGSTWERHHTSLYGKGCARWDGIVNCSSEGVKGTALIPNSVTCEVFECSIQGDDSVILCESHYTRLYNAWSSPERTSTGCGRQRKHNERFIRKCPNPELISRVLNLGTLANITPEQESLGFLAFVRLVGTAYFKLHLRAFVHQTPEGHYKTNFQKLNNTGNGLAGWYTPEDMGQSKVTSRWSSILCCITLSLEALCMGTGT